jgi:hypothetical protein
MKPPKSRNWPISTASTASAAPADHAGIRQLLRSELGQFIVDGGPDCFLTEKPACHRIAKLIPNDLNATIDSAIEKEPRLREEMKKPQIANLIEIAKRLEGLSRHASTHAAGVVIAPKPLMELIPLAKSNKDELTTQYGMKDLETIGLLKMDFLALATLTAATTAARASRYQPNGARLWRPTKRRNSFTATQAQRNETAIPTARTPVSPASKWALVL